MQIRTFLLVILLLTSAFAKATTWDEPWAEKIISKADYFVLGKVKSADEKKGITIKIFKTLGGDKLPDEIKITNFFLLDLCSVSGGHGPEFHFNNTKECYFFLKKNDSNEFCIATPSTGFDRLKDGKVVSTYRHSYHQALVPADVYEKTMTAIFNSYHNLPYDKAGIKTFIDKYITQKPAGFADDELETFFAQHVALESIYHLKLDGYYDQLLPFLRDNRNFHNRISAARALRNYNTDVCKQEMLRALKDKEESNFVKVICIWSLASFKPAALKKELQEISKNASEKENGFGGNIMDPRVCTHFPTVKSALDELIAML